MATQGTGGPGGKHVPVGQSCMCPAGFKAHGVAAAIITREQQGWPQLSAGALGQENPQKKSIYITTIYKQYIFSKAIAVLSVKEGKKTGLGGDGDRQSLPRLEFKFNQSWAAGGDP